MKDNMLLDSRTSENKRYLNPRYEKLSLINQKKDALLSMRLTLGIEKLNGPMITKAKLQQIISTEKKRIEDTRVKAEIDNIFAEYFPVKQELPVIPTAKNIWDNNSPVLKSGVEERINNELMSLNEMESSLNDNYVAQEGLGKAKVLNDPHNISTINNDIVSAA